MEVTRYCCFSSDTRVAATLVPGPGNLVQMAVWWHSAVVHVVQRVVQIRCGTSCGSIPRQAARWREAWEAFTNGRVVAFWGRRGVGSMWGRVAIYHIRPAPSPSLMLVIRLMPTNSREAI